MYHDLLKSQWPRLRREIRETWTRLEDDDIEIIAGDEEILIGTLQERYGRSREELEQEVDSWLAERRQEEPRPDEQEQRPQGTKQHEAGRKPGRVEEREPGARPRGRLEGPGGGAREG